MNIHEYQAKELLRQFGVPTPRGMAAFSAREAGEAVQQLFRLVLVDIHATPSLRTDRVRWLPGTYAPSCGAILVQASTRPFTDSTDLMNMLRSAALRSISTMRSAPPAPMITGTPT